VENLLEVDEHGKEGYFEKKLDKEIEEIGLLLGIHSIEEQES
jgi:hypothetical protein